MFRESIAMFASPFSSLIPKKVASIKKKKSCIFYLSPQVGELRRSTKVREASDINNACSSSISSATKVHLSFAA